MLEIQLVDPMLRFLLFYSVYSMKGDDFFMGKIELKSKQEISIGQGLDKFIRHCKIRNLSDYTIKYYKNCYNYLLKFLTSEMDENDDMLARKIDNEIIGDFTLWLVENYNMRNTTINSHIRGIRAYLYYLMENGYMNRFKVNTRAADDISKEVYSDEELTKLLNKPDLNDTNFADYRNWVIINFLLGTAARARTLRNIRIEDIFIDEAMVRFNVVKNKKQQIIPLSKSLVKVLEEYINIRDGEPEEYLFCNIYGDKLHSSSFKFCYQKI